MKEIVHRNDARKMDQRVYLKSEPLEAEHSSAVAGKT